MRIYIKFWGTRGSIPTPGDRDRKYGGNTACIEIRCGTTCSFATRAQASRNWAPICSRAKPPHGRPFFFSHAHWDHIQGFPFFVPAVGREIVS